MHIIKDVYSVFFCFFFSFFLQVYKKVNNITRLLEKEKLTSVKMGNAKISVNGSMIHPFAAHPAACLRMLLRVVGSCSLKFETGQTFRRAKGRNNPQNCWVNNVRSYYVRLHVALL